VAVPRYLIATDADWILDEVQSALEGPDTIITVCRAGKQVVPTAKAVQPDLCILDLQIGTMGGMAVTMELRLEESGGRLPHIPVLMLLDRHADIFLASRAGAEGWLIKPLDPLRLRKAAGVITSGGTLYEGLPAPPAPDGVETDEDAEAADATSVGDADGASAEATGEGGADGAEALSG
jgi:DNA-binding response OmpR family regulator